MLNLKKLIKISGLSIILLLIIEVIGYADRRHVNVNQQVLQPTTTVVAPHQRAMVHPNQPRSLAQPARVIRNANVPQHPVVIQRAQRVRSQNFANTRQVNVNNVNQQGRRVEHWHHRNQNWNNGFYSTLFYGFYPIVAPFYYDYDTSQSNYTVSNTPEYTNTNTVQTVETTYTNDNQVPNGNWVPFDNYNIPNNAVVYQDENGNSGYYCRALFNNQLYYGQFIPNDGCYSQDQGATIRFDKFDILVQ